MNILGDPHILNTHRSLLVEEAIALHNTTEHVKTDMDLLNCLSV